MKNMNTTLELPEGSKATIQGKVIDGKNYLVVEVEQEPELFQNRSKHHRCKDNNGALLKEGDLAIFWNYEPREATILAPYKHFVDGSYVDHMGGLWENAIKWDGTKEQYERALQGLT